MDKFTPEERKKRQDNASGKMVILTYLTLLQGELLLKGWAMLGSVCEDCNVPLMRNKEKDEICVVCDHNYRKDVPPPPVKKEQPPTPTPVQ